MWIVKINIFTLDLDLLTFVLQFDLDFVNIYVYTANEVPNFTSSKVTAWTYAQTDRQIDIFHTWLKLLPTHVCRW